MAYLMITPKGILNECLLTAREVDMLKLVAHGCTDKEIGAHLCIATETVKKHLKNSYKKLSAHNRIDAVRKAGLF